MSNRGLKNLVESTNRKLTELNLPPKITSVGGSRELDKLGHSTEDSQTNWGSELGIHQDEYVNDPGPSPAEVRTQKAPGFKNDESPEDLKELHDWVTGLQAQGIKVPYSVLLKLSSKFGN